MPTTPGAASMRAHVVRRYGGPEVVELADVPKPAPADDGVLIRIHATTVTSADWRVRTLDLPAGFGPLGRLAFGFTRPRQPILGTELAGVVEAVGKDVTRFRPGDEVVGFPGAKMGCHAEYRAMSQDGPVAPKPANLSFEEAACIPFGGTTALHFLRKARVEAGTRLLVIGASGGVGTAMVQLAKHLGAHVTGTTSTGNVKLVASLGADAVIDYTQEDYAASGRTFDVIADTVRGTSFAHAKRALRENGRYLAIAGGVPDLLSAMWAPLTGSKRVLAGPAPERPEDVRHLVELAEAGVLRPVIDRRYEFTEMREAHAHVATGRKKGNVVVGVTHEA